MRGVAPTRLTKLLRLQPVGMLLAILARRVISILALVALQRDDFSHDRKPFPFSAACPAYVERGTGFEPATIGLEGRDSTAELPPPVPMGLEPGTGIEPVTSSLPRTRSTI